MYKAELDKVVRQGIQIARSNQKIHGYKKKIKWQQAEINRLRDIIYKEYEQLCRINDCPRDTTAFWQIESAKEGLNRALNDESGEIEK